MTDPNALLSLQEARQRLHVTGQSYGGLQTIPLERIIGTLDRSIDFDRHFRPRRRGLLTRLAGLATAFSVRDFPPISVYELGARTSCRMGITASRSAAPWAATRSTRR